MRKRNIDDVDQSPSARSQIKSLSFTYSSSFYFLHTPVCLRLSVRQQLSLCNSLSQPWRLDPFKRL